MERCVVKYGKIDVDVDRREILKLLPACHVTEEDHARRTVLNGWHN